MSAKNSSIEKGIFEVKPIDLIVCWEDRVITKTDENFVFLSERDPENSLIYHQKNGEFKSLKEAQVALLTEVLNPDLLKELVHFRQIEVIEQDVLNYVNENIEHIDQILSDVITRGGAGDLQDQLTDEDEFTVDQFFLKNTITEIAEKIYKVNQDYFTEGNYEMDPYKEVIANAVEDYFFDHAELMAERFTNLMEKSRGNTGGRGR